MQLKSIKDLPLLEGKRVLVRIDLNVPRKNGQITDYTRITRALETIKYLIRVKAKIVILSHLGRPKGKFIRELSLAPIADVLQKFLNKKIEFCSDIFHKNSVDRTHALQPGEILLVENLRFCEGEEKNDSYFINKLAELGDYYINDTFSCSHRAHASITGITTKLPSVAGFLLQDELYNINNFLTTPTSPFAGIIGGAKISTKLGLLKSLVTKLDYLIIGGAMANNFLLARNIDIGNSLVEKELLEEVKEIMKLANENNCSIILPEDFIVGTNLATEEVQELKLAGMPLDNMQIYDIGPKSLFNIEHVLDNCKTIIWNGPVGAFETEPFDISSRQLVRILANLSIYKNVKIIAGGGDTVAVIKSAGLINSFTYISTGGGAFLELLEGTKLPGIEALKKDIIVSSQVLS